MNAAPGSRATPRLSRGRCFVLITSCTSRCRGAAGHAIAWQADSDTCAAKVHWLAALINLDVNRSSSAALLRYTVVGFCPAPDKKIHLLIVHPPDFRASRFFGATHGFSAARVVAYHGHGLGRGCAGQGVAAGTGQPPINRIEDSNPVAGKGKERKVDTATSRQGARSVEAGCWGRPGSAKQWCAMESGGRPHAASPAPLEGSPWTSVASAAYLAPPSPDLGNVLGELVGAAAAGMATAAASSSSAIVAVVAAPESVAVDDEATGATRE